MPIPAALTELVFEPLVHHVDERWTMAYAAGMGLNDGVYLDTTRPGGIVAHPLFSVCPEWPAIVSSRTGSESLGVTAAEVQTGVHATHDVTVHRLVRPGDVLTTSMEIVAVEAKRPGARTTTLLTTVDEHGELVATTRQDAIYLGVATSGQDRTDPNPPQPVVGAERRGEPTEVAIELARGAAHIYTECARIWNPIHTDPVVAQAAGLPGIIMHGTANLAHGVSAVISSVGAAGSAAAVGSGDTAEPIDPTALWAAPQRPDMVRRIQGRFSAMVALPSIITVVIWPANQNADGSRTVPFEVRNAAGEAAVGSGAVVLGAPD